MLDADGREYQKIVDVGTAPVRGGMVECHLACQHVVFVRNPKVGHDARCKRCERLSERTDYGDQRNRAIAGRAA